MNLAAGLLDRSARDRTGDEIVIVTVEAILGHLSQPADIDFHPGACVDMRQSGDDDKNVWKLVTSDYIACLLDDRVGKVPRRVGFGFDKCHDLSSSAGLHADNLANLDFG